MLRPGECWRCGAGRVRDGHAEWCASLVPARRELPKGFRGGSCSQRWVTWWQVAGTPSP